MYAGAVAFQFNKTKPIYNKKKKEETNGNQRAIDREYIDLYCTHKQHQDAGHNGLVQSTPPSYNVSIFLTLLPFLLDDTDTHMPTSNSSTSTPTPHPSSDPTDDPTLDLTYSDSPTTTATAAAAAPAPDTPPPTNSTPLFPHLTHGGMETPPPTAASLHFHHQNQHQHQNPQLLTPKPTTTTTTTTTTSTPPSSQPQAQQQQQQHRESVSMGMGSQMQMQVQMELARKGIAEAWVAAGWGGKKMLEDYELQRDRLLDGGLNLGKLGFVLRPPPRSMC